MFWLKLRQYKGSMLPQFLTSCRQIWQAYKIMAKDEKTPGAFLNSAPIIFYDSNSAVLYAANGDFSLNACSNLKTISIKNRQEGIRAQVVLKLISKTKWRKFKMTATLTSGSERVSLNYEACIRLQTKILKLYSPSSR